MRKYMLWIFVISILTYIGCKKDDNSTNPVNNADFNNYKSMWDSMIVKIDAISITGDLDMDFINRAVPHFQAEINMLNYYRTNGTDDSLKTLFKSMIDSSTAAINVFQSYMSTHFYTPALDTIYRTEFDSSMNNANSMVKNLSSKNNSAIDLLNFLIIHHNAGIAAESIFLDHTNSSTLVTYVQHLINLQSNELAAINTYLQTHTP